MTVRSPLPFASDVATSIRPPYGRLVQRPLHRVQGLSRKRSRRVDRMLHIDEGATAMPAALRRPRQLIARISTGQGVEEKDRAYLLTGGQARASRDGDWSESYICNCSTGT